MRQENIKKIVSNSYLSIYKYETLYHYRLRMFNHIVHGQIIPTKYFFKLFDTRIFNTIRLKYTQYELNDIYRANNIKAINTKTFTYLYPDPYEKDCYKKYNVLCIKNSPVKYGNLYLVLKNV
jgi:hypothetical protein